MSELVGTATIKIVPSDGQDGVRVEIVDFQRASTVLDPKVIEYRPQQARTSAAIENTVWRLLTRPALEAETERWRDLYRSTLLSSAIAETVLSVYLFLLATEVGQSGSERVLFAVAFVCWAYVCVRSWRTYRKLGPR